VALGVVALAAGGTALACGAVALGSWRALLRTGNPTVGFFVAGFALFAVKNALKAGLAFADAPEAALVESLFSLSDLAAVVLIAWPLVRGGSP
jgi:hypothetical protein